MSPTRRPFTDAKEQLGGYFVIEVPDRDVALEWATRTVGINCLRPGTAGAAPHDAACCLMPDGRRATGKAARASYGRLLSIAPLQLSGEIVEGMRIFEEARRWINSGGLATMGLAIPYAKGIKLAPPDSHMFCITGNGLVQMSK